jgi:hypothetical protein
MSIQLKKILIKYEVITMRLSTLIKEFNFKKSTHHHEICPHSWWSFNHIPFLVPARPALLFCRFEHLVVSLQLTFFLLNLSLCVGNILVPQMELLDHLIPPFRVSSIVTSIATIFILMENVNKGPL